MRIKWLKGLDTNTCRNYVYEDENIYISIWYYSWKMYKYELSCRLKNSTEDNTDVKHFLSLKEAKEYALKKPHKITNYIPQTTFNILYILYNNNNYIIITRSEVHKTYFGI